MTHCAETLEGTIAELLAEEEGVRFGLLFGSQATGKAGADSDIDLALGAAGVDLLALAARISTALGADVDVVSVDDVTIPLLEELIEHARVIYERDPGDATRWRSKALITLETDRPWYARMRNAWLSRVAERGL